MRTTSNKIPFTNKTNRMAFLDDVKSPGSPIKDNEPKSFTHFKKYSAAKISNDAIFCQRFSPDGSMVAAALMSGVV